MARIMSLRAALSASRRTWPAFGALGLMWGAFAAAIPAIKQGIGAGDGAFGLALFGSPLGLLLAMWAAPRLDARMGRFGLPFCVCAAALAFLPVGLTGTLMSFAMAMFLVGVASGSLDIITNSRISDAEQSSATSLMNLNHAIFSACYASGAILSGLGREAGLAPVAIFGLVGAVAILLALRTISQAAPVDDSEDAPGQFPTALAWWAGGALILAFFAENATETWSALHLERTLGGRAAEGALGPGLMGAMMFAGRMGGQLVAERAAPARIIRWASALAAIGATLAAVAPNLPVAYGGFAALGLGISVLAPMILSLTGARVARRHRTAAIARVAGIGFLGFIIAPPVMGLLAEALSLRASFLFVGILMLTMPLLIRMLGRAA